MQGPSSFRLVVRRGPQPNQIYELNKDIVTIGRDITNDIVINDPEVSRHHLRFTRGAGSFTIEDLGSTNGTFINGQRLTGAKPLSNGDMIGLGETVTLGYEILGAAAAGMPPEAHPTAVSPVPPQQPPPQPRPAPGAPPAQQDYAPYSPTPAGYTTTPPQAPGAGYDYDPYAVREEEPTSPVRWVVIGCVALTLFCCCITIFGMVLIDQACLWDDLPIISDILRALAISTTC